MHGWLPGATPRCFGRCDVLSGQTGRAHFASDLAKAGLAPRTVRGRERRRQLTSLDGIRRRNPDLTPLRGTPEFDAPFETE
jgi:hypothetical protein